MRKKKENFKDLNVEELRKKADSLRHELFSLRLNSVTAHAKDYSQFKKLRGNIARTLTYLRQKEAKNG